MRKIEAKVGANRAVVAKFGFTLIELLVVIAIIAILAAMLLAGGNEVFADGSARWCQFSTMFKFNNYASGIGTVASEQWHRKFGCILVPGYLRFRQCYAGCTAVTEVRCILLPSSAHTFIRDVRMSMDNAQWDHLIIGFVLPPKLVTVLFE